MFPAASVILPCYNHQAYVREAVSSVLRQTVTDIEIIAIDDASTDDTAQILESFDDRRLTVIRHENNQGSARTINEGIRRARAPYLAILNSDDLFWPDRLAECLDAARQTEALLLGTDLELVNGAGEVVRDRGFWWLEWYRGLKETYRLSGDLAGTLIAGNVFITTSNFFLNRWLIQSIGPFADHRYVQDYEFLLRAVAAYPRKVVWLEKTLLSYRLHGKNTILDDPLVPARQTLEILARWMPDLAVGDRAAARLHQFETHLLKLAGYIESGASRKVHALWQADAAHYQALLQEREQSLQALSGQADDLRRQEQDLQQELVEIRNIHAAERERSLQLQESVNQLSGVMSGLQRGNDEFHATLDRLRHDNDDLRATLDRLRHDNDDLYVELDRLRHDNADLLGSLGRQREELERLYSSRSFRLGYSVLRPARWLRRLFRK